MRLIIVSHELADEFSFRDHRDEAGSANAFGSDCRLQSFREIGKIDVGDTDRLGILSTDFPG